VAAAENALPDWLPPETKLVIGVRVRSLVDSQLVHSALAQTPGMPPEAAAWLSVASAMGFDPLHDLDEVLIASTAQSAAQSTAQEATAQEAPKKEDAPVLMLIRGRFNLDKLAAGTAAYHGIPLVGGGKMGGGKDSTGVLAFLDGSTAVAGELPVVRAAIDRRGRGGIGAELAARIEAVRGRYDIWGVGDRPEGFVPPASTPREFASVDRFQFGISMSHGLELAAEIHTASLQDAERMMASMGLLEALIKARQPQASSAKFEVRADQGTLRVSLSVSEEELKKAIDSQAALIQSAMQSGSKSGPSAVAPAATAAPPVPATPDPKTATASPRVLNPGGGTAAITLPGRP
jgi:hypothetical protein